MFDYFRKHTRVALLILVLLVIPSFVLFGIEGYTRFREGQQAVAKVDGQRITQQEWDAVHRSEVERYRAQLPGVDVRLFDSPQAKMATLERIVRERVLVAASEKLHLTATDQRLQAELLESPAIASLRMPDGSIDVERYKLLLGAQGMTPEMFEARMRRDLAMRQVLNGVSGTGFVSKTAADTAINAFFQRREIQVARFIPADFAAKVQPAEAELDKYYQAHASEFLLPEQASIEYVVLDLDAVLKSTAAPEAEVRSYYEQNVARYSTLEQRRASHILIAADRGAPAAERQKAKDTAQALLAELKKKPDSFAELAKKHSQDPGSAAQGGDLDFFGRGAMVKAFEDAAFALKLGEVSGVVESDFGYHLIKLTAVRGGERRSFESVRGEIEAELKRQLAQRKYAEAAELFSNTVYEQADSLKPAADKLKLEIQTAQNVGRTPNPAANGPLANAKFLESLFSADSVRSKRNTEAVEIGPNQLVSGRLVQYAPARTLPFADVKQRVRERVVAARAAELAKREGEARLAAWKQSTASAGLGPTLTVGREQAGGQARAVVDAALRADPSQLPAWAGVDLGAQGYVVVRINRIAPSDAGAIAGQAPAQVAQAWSAAESVAYYEALKRRMNVEITAKPPSEAPVGGTSAALD